MFTVVVTTLVDIVLHMVRVYPPMDQPMKHALVLGVVGTFLGLLGLVMTWDLGLGPHWYPIALVMLAIPQCWAGGWIHGLPKKGGLA